MANSYAWYVTIFHLILITTLVLEIRLCPNEDACRMDGRKDKLITYHGSLRGNVSTFDYSQYYALMCANGYTGHFCASCAPGYGWTDTATCVKCHHANGLLVAVLAIVSLLPFFLAAYSSRQTAAEELAEADKDAFKETDEESRASDEESKGPDQAVQDSSALTRQGLLEPLSPIIKVTMSYVQVLSLMRFIVLPTMPDTYNNAVAASEQVSDVPGTGVSLQCSLPDDIAPSKAIAALLLRLTLPIMAQVFVVWVVLMHALVPEIKPFMARVMTQLKAGSRGLITRAGFSAGPEEGATPAGDSQPVDKPTHRTLVERAAAVFPGWAWLQLQAAKAAEERLTARIAASHALSPVPAPKLHSQTQSLPLVYTVVLVLITGFFAFYELYVTLFLSMLACASGDSPSSNKLASSMGLLTGSWWQMDYNQRCFRGSHAALAFLLGIPGIIAFGLVIPLWLCWYLCRNAHRLEEPSFKAMWGFFFSEYTSSYFAWEVVIMMRKVSVSLVVVLLGTSPIRAGTQLLACMAIIGASLMAHVICKPYEDYKASRLETLSLSTIFMTLYLSMYTVLPDAPTPDQLIPWIIVLLNIVTMVVLGLTILSVFLKCIVARVNEIPDVTPQPSSVQLGDGVVKIEVVSLSSKERLKALKEKLQPSLGHMAAVPASYLVHGLVTAHELKKKTVSEAERTAVELSTAARKALGLDKAYASRASRAASGSIGGTSRGSSASRRGTSSGGASARPASASLDHAISGGGVPSASRAVYVPSGNRSSDGGASTQSGSMRGLGNPGSSSGGASSDAGN